MGSVIVIVGLRAHSTRGEWQFMGIVHRDGFQWEIFVQ